MAKGNMQNIEVQVQGNKLVLVVDLSTELGLSASGKSVVIATTRGNVDGMVPGYEEVSIGLNVYRPNYDRFGR